MVVEIRDGVPVNIPLYCTYSSSHLYLDKNSNSISIDIEYRHTVTIEIHGNADIAVYLSNMNCWANVPVRGDVDVRLTHSIKDKLPRYYRRNEVVIDGDLIHVLR